ncbi:hypothetical protein D9615_004863 [Tricholomella constricta]|uniref:Uncharacterized protein n=1 Tax=Tricholomella constricta TaxID=117010 RepID=A0A8H5M783_9AGAR|nr:hypothetical protein D9615_006915 [Tricholomella constricta]KAF5383244.1 hypothetical protein D9615_004862 [Tricholomella constricta]KAF5383245.1 hypothetical protein D9615_004863 [Tricholomella constricta]
MSRPLETLAALKEDWLRWLALPDDLHPDERVPVLEDLQTGLRRLHRQAPGPDRVVWEAEAEAKQVIWAVIRLDPILAARFSIFRPTDLPSEETTPAQSERSSRGDNAPGPPRRTRTRWDVAAAPPGGLGMAGSTATVWRDIVEAEDAVVELPGVDVAESVVSVTAEGMGDAGERGRGTPSVASGGEGAGRGDVLRVPASPLSRPWRLKDSRHGRPKPRPRSQQTGLRLMSTTAHGEYLRRKAREVAGTVASPVVDGVSDDEVPRVESSRGPEASSRRSGRIPGGTSKVEVVVPLPVAKRKRGAAADETSVVPVVKKAKGRARSAVSPSVTVEKVAHLKEAVPGWFERPIPCDRCRKQGVSCPQNPERGPCLRCQAQRKGCVTQSDTGAVVGVASSRSRRRVAPSGAVEVSGEGAGAGESGPASWFPIVKGEHIRGASLRAASARAEGGVVGSEFLHGEHVPVGVRDALAEANEMLGRDQLAQRSLVDEVDVVGLQTLRASRHAVLRVLVQEAHLAAARVEIARDTLSQVRQRLADTVAALNEVDDRLEQLDAEAGDVVTDDGEAWGGIVDDGMED